MADLTEDHKHKSRGCLSSTTEITHDEVHQAASMGSSFSGQTIFMESGKDTTVKGSAILEEGDVTIQAGGNAHITASEDTVQELHQKEVKKSGLLGREDWVLPSGKNRRKTAMMKTIPSRKALSSAALRAMCASRLAKTSGRKRP